MPNLSDDQLTAIAHQLHDLSTAVGTFRLGRIHDGSALDDPAIVQLLGIQWSLLNTSSSFFIQAAQVSLQNADKAAAQVLKATKAANDALKTLKAISAVISVASSAGLLAGAVMTGQMDQIAGAAKQVFTAIQSASSDAADDN